EFQHAIAFSGGSTVAQAALGHAYAVAGKRSEAQRVLKKMKELANQRYVSSYDMAIIFTGLGEKEQAFKSLRKAYEDRDGRLLWLKVHPRFDDLRPEPPFADLLRRMGLADKAAAGIRQGIRCRFTPVRLDVCKMPANLSASHGVTPPAEPQGSIV